MPREMTINEGVFNTIFKNAMRDYYTYGFRAFGESDRAAATQRADWERLNAILRNYFEWTEMGRGRGGNQETLRKDQVLFASKDTRFQNENENPLHRVYRFCRYDETSPMIFFDVLLALATNGLNPAAEDVAFFQSGQTCYEEYENRRSCDNGLSTAALDYLSRIGSGQMEIPSNYNKMNIRMNELKRLGIVADVGRRKHRWKLRGNTPARLMEAGQSADANFETHFAAALSFYARTMPLGEIGSYLLERCRLSASDEFRFRHDYMIHALYDYNLIDLLFAAEEERWCELTCKYAISEEMYRVVCLPLEIRISAEDGREFLIAFDPASHHCISLRVEFIDRIEYIQTLLTKDGQKEVTVGSFQEEIDAAREMLRHVWGTSVSDADLREGGAKTHVFTMKLSYSPGEEDYILNRVRREGRFGHSDVENEYIKYQVNVTDCDELIPWIRSFYTRICELRGDFSDAYDMSNDVGQICENLEKSLAFGEKRKREERFGRVRPEEETTESFLVRKYRKDEHAEPHYLLFHEIYSIYFGMLADILVQTCADDKAQRCGYTYSELLALARKSVRRYDDIYREVIDRDNDRKSKGADCDLLENELCYSLISGPFFLKGQRGEDGDWVDEEEAVKHPNDKMVRSYLPIFCLEEKPDLFRDKVPLSDLESGWLLSMLADERIGAFLTEKEREAVYRIAKDGERNRALPFQFINYYDRYQEPQEKMTIAHETKIVWAMLSAMHNKRVVSVQYKETRPVEYAPIRIEYSARSGRFQGCFRTAKGKRGKYADILINLREVKAMAEIELPEEGEKKTEYKTYDPSSIYAWYDAKYRVADEDGNPVDNERMRTVTVVFSDRGMLADRILSEFAPWGKKCVYDRKTKIFRLTISYWNDDEEREIVIRLLRYGADLRLEGSAPDALYRDYNRRVRRQAELSR